MKLHEKINGYTDNPVNPKYSSTTDIFKLFQLDQFPYSAKISFAPLIKYWKTQINSEDRIVQLIAKEIDVLMQEKGEILKKPVENLEVLQGLDDLISLLTSLYFPHHDKKALIRITGPFNTHSFYHSPALIDLLKHNSITTNLDKHSGRVFKFIIYRAGVMILNRYYGQQLELETPYILTVKEENSPLEKHFITEIDSRFVEVRKLKRLKKLSDEQIQELRSNVEDIDLWLKYLPPANFEFQGVFSTHLSDITSAETLSRLKDSLLEKAALLNIDKVKLLELKLCTYFNQTDLVLGVCTVDYPKSKLSTNKYSITHGLLSEKFPNLLTAKNQGSIYEKVAASNDFLVIENLEKYKNPTQVETELLKLGIRSILVAPLQSKNGRIIGLLELGCPRAFVVNSLTVLKLKGIISLFNVAIERSRREIDNQIDAIIRDRFTSIHPSVEWAFVKKALHILKRKEGPGFSEEESFVFKDVFPLYGQADIVSSTVTRNKAVQGDLIENLYQIKKLLILCTKYFPFPLAEQITQEVDIQIDQIKRDISSNTEFQILEFIKKEVHPLLRYLKKKDLRIKAAFQDYASFLDHNLGIVYKKRKDYEVSVAMINRTLSEYLDEQQMQAQKMYTHYYEKFQTDGIAYNIYIGQSLLKKGKYHRFQLRNLRLWQLITMCEMTRKIAAIQGELPIPLQTAQLILVHSSPITIRFRLDEKRFDVDGAYNARYEVIKKRIDKALIEGTGERLTVSGKIAIVYQQEKDRREYMHYLHYLTKKGLIHKKYEDLNLKKLQGVQGLKALRISVIG